MSGIFAPLLPFSGYLALLIRVWTGVNLAIHGYPKLGKQGRQQSMGWMKSMGIPGLTAVLAGVLEFFGGLFLVVGLIVPVVALLSAIQFFSIIIMKKAKMNAVYIGQNKPTYEIDVLYLMLAIVILVLGAGAFSLDGLIGF
ncbi:MAG: DoxX family protein [Nitrososphaerota archaeon]|nr:DoxX family protein [Nitrososphaerota archaeon]